MPLDFDDWLGEADYGRETLSLTIPGAAEPQREITVRAATFAEMEALRSSEAEGRESDAETLALLCVEPAMTREQAVRLLDLIGIGPGNDLMADVVRIAYGRVAVGLGESPAGASDETPATSDD